MAPRRKETRTQHRLIGLSDAHFALAQQVAHLGSWELDLTDLEHVNDNPLRWSDETFRLLGYAPGEVDPSNAVFFKAVHPDDRAKIRKAVDRAIKEQIPYNIEHRVIWRDGTERMVHEMSTIVYDDHGSPSKMLGVVQDITQRKKSETDLDLQSLILSKLADSIIVLNAYGRIMYWNEGAEAIFGYRRSEILDQSVSRLYPTADVQNLTRDIEQIVAGQDYIGEWEGLRKNGQRVWVDVRATALKDGDGRLIGILSIARDITVGKREQEAVRDSERLYRAVGESINYGVWVCDPKGRLTHMSDSFLNLLGLTREQNISDGWLNALDPEERPAIMNAWRECLAQGKPWNRRYQIRGIDGQYHPVLTHGAPVRDESGRILCWAGLNLDVSQIK